MHLEKFEELSLEAEERNINNCALTAKVLENEGCLRIAKLESSFRRDQDNDKGSYYKVPVLRLQVVRGEHCQEGLAKLQAERRQRQDKL
jgi:hypothetical protein